MTDDTQTPGAPPSLTLGGEMVDGDFSAEFLGTVITDTWQMGQLGKWQWHLAVKPTDIQLQGQTGAFHTWYNYSDRRNSALGAAREAMIGLFPEDLELGKGHLVGKVAWWVRKDLEFGVDRQTGEKMVARQVLIPTRPASEEEATRATAAGGHSGPAAPVEATADLGALDPEQLDKVLALVHGKSKPELQFAVARAKDLPKEIKQGLLSGTLTQALLDTGAVRQDSDGRYVATDLAAT